MIMFCDNILNCWQNSWILIPAGPKQVPTGGAGVAFPAAICNFIFVTASFATKNTVVATISQATLSFCHEKHLLYF